MEKKFVCDIKKIYEFTFFFFLKTVKVFKENMIK